MSAPASRHGFVGFRFPRAHRFVLGDRIANTALDILEGLGEASHLRDKRAVLRGVHLKLERLRSLLLRMSQDLQALSLRTVRSRGARHQRGGRYARWLAHATTP